MKRLPPLAFLAFALVFAAPASAKVSLNAAIKNCKAEIAKMTPPPKSSRAIRDQAALSETQLWIEFKYTDAEGRLDKLTCKVDRATGAAEVQTR